MRAFGSLHGPTIGTFRVLIVFITLMMGQSSFARVQTSGEMLTLEMKLVPFLATGGALNDLCEDGALYHSGCVECDRCCMQVLAVPKVPDIRDVWMRVAALRLVHPFAAVTPPSRAPLGPPVRAPPILT